MVPSRLTSCFWSWVKLPGSLPGNISAAICLAASSPLNAPPCLPPHCRQKAAQPERPAASVQPAGQGHAVPAFHRGFAVRDRAAVLFAFPGVHAGRYIDTLSTRANACPNAHATALAAVAATDRFGVRRRRQQNITRGTQRRIVPGL
ncbi:hypothetical protein BBAD15_g8639 [Beauveria bassiana D1-5]|uniref:Uncharacterized protein n=1 Tax=Beauveria bassiana D1-5 TaxID=1245745 RepID=A0A0A2VIA4_BEABA|nr:hypothetical protein BBAD15_g8639 [Beauveria bassiana D1-5]